MLVHTLIYNSIKSLKSCCIHLNLVQSNMRLFLLFPHKYFGLTSRLDLKPFTNRYEIQTSYFNSDIKYCSVNGEKTRPFNRDKNKWVVLYRNILSYSILLFHFFFIITCNKCLELDILIRCSFHTAVTFRL